MKFGKIGSSKYDKKFATCHKCIFETRRVLDIFAISSNKANCNTIVKSRLKIKLIICGREMLKMDVAVRTINVLFFVYNVASV